jgi:hypothetical protein
MKSLPLILVITLGALLAFAQDQSITLGSIDFYGYAGVDTEKLRAALPLRAGDALSRESRDKIVLSLRQAVKQALGREPSDVATLCCDERGRILIYIGLQRAEWAQRFQYNPAPQASLTLPPAAIEVYRAADEALSNAIMRGISGEDESQGYSLSVDPEARAKQLALHDYAARNAALLRRVLKSAKDTEQRRIAAELVGYTGSSQEQFDALVRASMDVDALVRNNAMRALGVVSRSNPTLAARVPAGIFIELLHSGTWTDRNKAAFVLSALTERRNPGLLARLKAKALDPLLEMARWHSLAHAYTPRLLVGRLAGIDEQVLIGMIGRGDVEPIIAALSARKK